MGKILRFGGDGVGREHVDEDARSLLQARLRVYHLLLFGIAAVQFFVSLRVTSAMEVMTIDEPFVLTFVLEGTLVVAVGGSWLLLRSRPLGGEVLAVVDLVVVGAIGFVNACIVVLFPAYYRLDLGMLMVMSQVLVVRAAMVLGSTAHTVGVGVAGMVPILIASLLTFRAAPLPNWLRPVSAQLAQDAVWAAIIIMVSAFTSRVIYRLRRQVAQATQLGQYTVERLIGRGGMGSVYLARHSLLRRPTALKVLESQEFGDEAVARFEREVQTTSELRHPNNVAIYDYGRTPDARLYYAMEYLDGVDLETLVRVDGPQPPARVMHILTQVCGALAEAHERGLVHRDIKPANIMLCERSFQPDFVKVLDFGLVRAPDPAPLDLSREHRVLGTPQYMAPEAITSPGQVDARADIYGVGAMAYFLLAGRPPFDSSSPVAVMNSHLFDAPDPLPHNGGGPVPAPLEALVLACLAKDPSGRPASMEALRLAVAALAVEPWTAAGARAWWRERAGAVRGQSRDSGPGGPPATVAIDLARRRTADAAAPALIETLLH
ncbi:MAG TPA: serine/threonine-protein kinase [Kofleriaceae bacterium]|nr:serine/threonine-protein kinase [Kofleriaceae bacterium]